MKNNKEEQEGQTCKLKRRGKKVGGVGVEVAFPPVFDPNVDTLGMGSSVGIQLLGEGI